MTQTLEFDIAIIGGGMVGASLASLLSAAQPAWKIALIEASPTAVNTAISYSPSFDARSTALAYGSADIFQQLGLWQQLQQHVTPIRQVHISDQGHFAGGLIDATQFNVEALGYVIENAWLGQVLSVNVQQQKNITCFAPARAESLTPQRAGALLRIQRDSEGATEGAINIRCDLTVIADGGDSPMRRALGVAAQVDDYQQSAIVTNIAFDRPHQGIAYERFTAQGPLALLPLGESVEGQSAALVWTLPSAEAARHLQLTDAEFLSALQAQFGYRLGRFERVGQRHAYPLQLITACEQVRSHVVLVGNAAHFLHPVAGQGFNLALRDCACLVETLVEAYTHGQPLGELAQLQVYCERQRVDQQLTITFSDRLVRAFSSNRLPLIALRHLGFISLAVLPPLKRALVAQTMGSAGRRSRWQSEGRR